MPSRVSFFSPAIYRKNLTRFVPLWVAYLVFWLVALPLNILSHRGDTWVTVWTIREWAFGAVEFSAIVCMAYAVLVAMALYGWYYRSASVNAFAALPIQREAWFCTNLLTALTMGLIPNLIVALAMWAAAGALGLAGGMAAMSWLAITSLIYVFFYALAVLCAAVVGQILALPALYLLVNFTAVVVNFVTVTILSTFVYGMNAHHFATLAPLSPAFYLLTRNLVKYDYIEIESTHYEIADIHFEQWGYLLGLTAAAVIMLGIAFLLFQRRRMESAGDMIAVRPLRPVFKYCFAAGCALVLGTLAAFVFFSGRSGPSVAVMLLSMLAGGFIGYFTAEILLKKTFRVFGREWIGYGAFALCLTAAVLMMEFDVTGFERRVPNMEDVESVSTQHFGSGYGSGGSFTVDDPALIADFMALHRSIIQDKKNQDALARSDDTGAFNTFYLDYHLRDGTVMERQYDVYCTEEQWRNADHPARLMYELFSEPAILLLANLPDFPIEGPENIIYAQLNNESLNVIEQTGGKYEDRPVTRSERELTLTQEEAWKLFTTCVLPDLRDGKIGKPRFYYFQNEPRYRASIDLKFSASLERFDWCELTLTPGSRTAQYFIDQGCILLTDEEIDELWNAWEQAQ